MSGVSTVTGCSSGIGSSMAHAAPKSALNTLSMSFACVLAPGFVETPWQVQGYGAERYARIKETCEGIAPLKSVATPRKV